MFQSATLKLTGWYLLIIMVISLIFSVLVYQATVSELVTRLERFGQGIPHDVAPRDLGIIDRLQELQAGEAARTIFIRLLYLNLAVLISGGVASYLLARQTLRPIQEAHEAQSRFTSDASHELRTPLAAMKTELEVALRDERLPAHEMRELLQSNLEEVDKLTDLSRTLLSLSKLDLGAIETEKLMLADIVREAIKRYKHDTKRVGFHAPKTGLPILANKAGVLELVTILLDNAIKYSPAGSPVNIGLTRRGSQAELSITNPGPGITPEDMPHIFERFYRADNSRTNSAENGYGLGLSLARKITDLHGGDITAESSADITVFRVLMPLHAEAVKKDQNTTNNTPA